MMPLAWLLVTILAASAAIPQDSPQIHLPYGLIEGTLMTPDEINEPALYSFLGIPYADPPTGELRFRPPKPKSSWKGVLSTKEFGPICHQFVDVAQKVLSPFALPQDQDDTSEDCLYLNVYTPRISKDAMLPVVIYIHGGTFSLGMGSVFDGARIAVRENVVAVSFNYRLGALGFLSTRDDAAPGNYGLLDQVAVLQWVRTNIAKFGGNPKKVTLWGEEAGATSISLHMVSPLTEDLFHNAIIHSGYALRAGFIDSQHRERATLLAEFVPSCKKTPEVSTEVMIQCLRQVDVSDILKVQLHFYRIMNHFGPSVDGYYLPNLPQSLFLEGRSHPVSLLTGFTSSEGFHFAKSRNPDYLIKNFHLRSCLTSIKDWVQLSYPLNTEDVFNGVELHYFNGIHQGDIVKLRQRYYEAVGDMTVIAPTVKMAQLHTGPSYLYAFNYKPSSSPSPEWVSGATHAEERPFFYSLPLNFEDQYSEEDIKLAKRLNEYMFTFIREGNPNRAEAEVLWPQMLRGNRNILEIGIENVPSTSYRSFFMDFWQRKVGDIIGEKWDEITQKAEHKKEEL